MSEQISKINNNKEQRVTYIKWAASILIPIAMFFLIPTTDIFTLEIKKYACITLWALITWALELLPTMVSALLLSMLYIVSGVAEPTLVFASWSNPIIWLVIGGMLITTVFNRTGLMKRIAFKSIILSGGTYNGIIAGLILSGIVTNLLIPNMTGRVTLYAALGFGVCTALNIKPNTKASAGIMFASFMGAVAPGNMYLTGNDNHVVIADFLSAAGYNIDWFEFFIANFPSMLVWTIASIFLIQRMYKQDTDIESKSFFEEEYNALGKIKTSEKKLLIIMGIVVLFMLFGTINIAWIFLLSGLVCFLPGINLADESNLKELNFSMVIFIASTMSIGAISQNLGIGTIVATALDGFLATINSNTQFMIFGWILGVLVHFLMTPLASIAAFIPMLIEIAENIGLSPVGVSFAFVRGVEQMFFPYQWALLLIAYSFGMFKAKDVTKFFAALMVLSFIILITLVIPVFYLTGFI